MYHVKKAQLFDGYALASMDAKYWDDLHTPDIWCIHEWEYRLQFEGTFLMCYYGTPVAFATYDAIDDDAAYLMKLVVQPQFRRMGVATTLLTENGHSLRQAGFRALRLMAPDRRLDPRLPDDLSAFLTNTGFRAVDFIRSENGVDDIAVFERPIENSLVGLGW